MVVRINSEMVLGSRFGPGWAATGLLHGAWRAAGAARGLPAALVIADASRRPTMGFLGVWRAAFPGVAAPRPLEPILTADGKGSDVLLDAFRAIPETP